MIAYMVGSHVRSRCGLINPNKTLNVIDFNKLSVMFVRKVVSSSD